jgi:hypothetical protein
MLMWRVRESARKEWRIVFAGRDYFDKNAWEKIIATFT